VVGRGLVLELFSPESLDGIDFASPKVLGIEWSDGEIPEATSAKVLGDKWLTASDRNRPNQARPRLRFGLV
jgi:hypothetical protein